MHEYFYKPKKKSLPSIPVTASTTYYNTFYTTTSKNKGKSANNSYKILNTNDNKIIFNSNLGKKLYLKTEQNSINENYYHRKKQIKNYLIPETDVSYIETDDTIFALSEIRRVDKKIAKRVNKNLIWKEKINSIYDNYCSKNRKDIRDIKERVRHNFSGINSKLRKQIYKNKYFPEEKVEMIKDAQTIMTKIKKNMNQERESNKQFNHFNKIDLHSFARQNREICLKNIFIDLIKDESYKILIKEKQINKALEEAKIDFQKDKEVFDEFAANKKKSFREKEIQLEESIKQNKIIFDQLKKCSSELHGTKDEIDKNIKDIVLYKEYADFVHQIIDDDARIKKVNLNKIMAENKGKNIDGVVKILLDEFSFLIDDYQFSLSDDLNNPKILTDLFLTMEANIINSIEERDITIREINKNRTKYEKELENLRDKIESDKKVLNSICQEIKIHKNFISPRNDLKKILEENEKYISIIYDELLKVTKQKKTIQNNNICSETLKLLSKIEDKLIILLGEMDKIKEIEKESNTDDGIFKNIIDKVKNDNKIEKYIESREISLKLKEEKNKKYQQRMNRYKKRGPIIFPPPWAIKKNKEKNFVKKDKNKDDEDILYY